MRSYIGIIVNFISKEKLHNAMLRLQTIQRLLHSYEHHNQQFEEIDSNFEITAGLLTNDFSALLDECSSLIDVVCLMKRFEPLILPPVTNVFKN